MDVSNWISVSATVITLAALILAYVEGFQNRKYNKLSAKPILTFFRYTIDGQITITLSNEGLGPAIIAN